MDKQTAYRIIDGAPRGSLFYRFIISPDPKREDRNHDLDMRDITEQTIRALEELIGREEPIAWIAATHQDHAPHLHTHVLAVLPKRLYKADLTYLRFHATKASRDQRRILDLAQYRGRERPYLLQRQYTSSRHHFSFQRRYRGSTRGNRPHVQRHTTGSYLKPNLHTCACPRCFATHVHHVRDPVHKCKSCGTLLHLKQQIRILNPSREHHHKEAAWER